MDLLQGWGRDRKAGSVGTGTLSNQARGQGAGGGAGGAGAKQDREKWVRGGVGVGALHCPGGWEEGPVCPDLDPTEAAGRAGQGLDEAGSGGQGQGNETGVGMESEGQGRGLPSVAVQVPLACSQNVQGTELQVGCVSRRTSRCKVSRAGARGLGGTQMGWRGHGSGGEAAGRRKRQGQGLRAPT